MNTTQMNKIQDIDEFAKLFKLNIPVHSEFDYYFNLIKMSKEYNLCEMDRNLRLFSQLEVWASENNENVHKFKMREIDRLKEIILQSKAYKKLNEAELPKTKFYSRDWLNQVADGEYLLSLDFVSANYSVLKTFDSDNELSDTWTEFCKTNALHEALILSKSFRQVVFGNTNPKRLQTWQHDRIIKVVEYLKSVGYEDDKFVFISHDEIILRVKDVEEIITIQNSCNQMKAVASGMNLKSTIFSLKKIKKNVFVKTTYEALSFFAGNTLRERYKTLKGVPGNKFFFYYKKYILGEPLDERDLMYYNDGELCKFIDEDAVKKQKEVLPHYEKPEYPVSIVEAKKEYSYIWDKLANLLPNMSDEEKRRVVEIFSNTCKSCYSASSKCRCWDDM